MLLVSTLTFVLALLPASSACCRPASRSRSHLLVEAALQRTDLILQLRDIALHFLLFLAGRKARARSQQKEKSNSTDVTLHSYTLLRIYRTSGHSIYPALLAAGEMRAPVSLPATFVGLRADRAFLAVADGLQPVRRNSQLDQEVAGGTGAAIAQAEVIFRGSALVAVPFHVDGGVGEIGEDALQRVGVGRQRGARVVANIVRIVVEERIAKIRLNARLERADGPLLLVTGGGGVAGPVTVTVAVALASPAGPLAVSL